MNYLWMYSVPSFLYLVFYVGAIVFLIAKRRQKPVAVRWASMGMFLMLFCHVAGWVVTMAMQRSLDQDAFLLFNGLSQIVISIARMGAYCMILAAIFMDQRPAAATAIGEQSRGVPPATSDNPYIPPMSQ